MYIFVERAYSNFLFTFLFWTLSIITTGTPNWLPKVAVSAFQGQLLKIFVSI